MRQLVFVSPSPLRAAAVAWRRRSARAAVLVLLARLATPVTVGGVQAVLRDALDDPTAAVFNRLPEGAIGLISATGGPEAGPVEVDLASGLGCRLVLPVSGQGGQVAALLIAGSSGGIAPDQVELALTACRQAVENARLQAILRSQLRDDEAARARIVAAALEERRKLAWELHDGAQQHLHALSTNLALARQKAAWPEAMATVDAPASSCEWPPAGGGDSDAICTRRCLRARGCLPPGVAGRGRAIRHGPECPGAPAGPEIEIVMYLTVRELLDGLAGRCAASRVTVTVAARNGRLSAAVASDGRLGDDDPVPLRLRGYPRSNPRRRRDHEHPAGLRPGDGTSGKGYGLRHGSSALDAGGRLGTAQERPGCRFARPGRSGGRGLRGLCRGGQGPDGRRPADGHQPGYPDDPTFTEEGLRATKQLKTDAPDLGILLQSKHVEVASAARLFDENSHEIGYLPRDRVDSVETVMDGLSRMVRGELVLDAELMERLFRWYRNLRLLEQLSGGEHTVSPHKAEGRSNPAIAAQMYVALKTVEGWGYAASVFTKLGLPPPADDNRRVLPVLTWLRTRPIRHADV